MTTEVNPGPGGLLARRIPLDTPLDAWPVSAPPASAESDEAVAAWRREIGERGLVLFDTATADLDDEAVVSAAWNAFTLMADVVPQYPTGELIDYIEVFPSATGSSHYSRTNATGGYHMDGTLLPQPPDMVLLACLSAAAEGGATIVMDATEICSALSAAGDHLLDVLGRTHPFSPGSGEPGPVQPVLVENGSRASLHYLRFYLEQGYLGRGQGVPSDLVAAMDVIDTFTADPANQVAVTLRRGQVLIFDNLRFIHGRRAFVNDEQRGVRRLRRVYGMHPRGDLLPTAQAR